MEVTRDPPQFRPVTIRLETQDELDQLLAIIDTVADNRINHTPPTIRAAMTMRCELNKHVDGAE